MIQEMPALFEQVALPDGVDRDILADTIISKYGELDVVYTNPRMLDYYNGVWFRRKFEIIKKMYATTQFEYDPIENYDRKEDYWETNNDVMDSESTSSDVTDTSNKDVTDGVVSTETINQVSPYNADSYINDSKNDETVTNDTTVTNAGNVKADSTSNQTTVDDRDKKGGLRAHGNIGVTTTQEMIEQERKSVQFDLYEWVAALWADDFLCMVWR